MIKMNNYRNPDAPAQATPEPLAKGAAKDSKGDLQASVEEEAKSQQSEQFNAEKIPTKVPLVKPSSSAGSTIVYHSEAPYLVRKSLIEQAKKTFKELEKAETNALLTHSHQMTKKLEEKFEENLIRNQGFGRGNMYNDQSTKIVFKTFLQE